MRAGKKGQVWRRASQHVRRPPSQARAGGGVEPVPLQTDEERAWRRKGERWRMKEGGYFHVQATKPEALAYAMLDSPVGVAAWIGEKFRTWIDGQQESLNRVIGRERLLTNLMLYIVNDAFGSASWTYYGYSRDGDSLLPPGRPGHGPDRYRQFPARDHPVPAAPFRRHGSAGPAAGRYPRLCRSAWITTG